MKIKRKHYTAKVGERSESRFIRVSFASHVNVEGPTGIAIQPHFDPRVGLFFGTSALDVGSRDKVAFASGSLSHLQTDGSPWADLAAVSPPSGQADGYSEDRPSTTRI
jgi:hypothetical protein